MAKPKTSLAAEGGAGSIVGFSCCRIHENDMGHAVLVRYGRIDDADGNGGMSEGPAVSITTEFATRAEMGPRDRQEDRVRTFVNADGSWVMAVADGLGGHPFGDEAAQAATDALPGRITNQAEMAAAFDAANAAAWGLHPEMRSPDEVPAGHLESLSEDVPAARVQGWISGQGLLVVLATDGLFDPVLMTHDRGWFGDDPHDLSLGFALPPERRESADTVADTLMDTARFAGLIDNTTIAVARLAPG